MSGCASREEQFINLSAWSADSHPMLVWLALFLPEPTHPERPCKRFEVKRTPDRRPIHFALAAGQRLISRPQEALSQFV